ncbi:hypothetical protein NC661_03480 [Aquibacillus koreensis]|uniref:Uncharacterized protein n=1 Tax=Aquibacillus koreensis TaxID=279446 RepID=A0A9X4AIL1_9BACI|nr:hypothetical protein [Aquibacillus koreensis]MCT2536489.1 hypothetical protein [Aquibacillus koreensis]MDC3419423.1 hypothetical protein [Aquibacillus koreensis]
MQEWKKMKKGFITLLAVLMITGFATGCSEDTEDNESEDNNTEENAEE